MEIQRLCPVVPLGVPHGSFFSIFESQFTFFSCLFTITGTLEEVTIEGKWILPPGCMLMIAHWSINYDEEYFEDPYTFQPFRFLSEDEKSVKKDINLMPFQVGRRRCVGEEFGQIMVFMSVLKFVNEFRMTLSKPYDFSIEPERGFTRAPREFTLELEEK